MTGRGETRRVRFFLTTQSHAFFVSTGFFFSLSLLIFQTPTPLLFAPSQSGGRKEAGQKRQRRALHLSSNSSRVMPGEKIPIRPPFSGCGSTSKKKRTQKSKAGDLFSFSFSLKAFQVQERRTDSSPPFLQIAFCFGFLFVLLTLLVERRVFAPSPSSRKAV